MAKPSVYVTRQVPQAGIDMLREACEVEVWEGELPVPREILMEKVSHIDGLYCLLTERIDAELLDAAPHLRVVSNMAVGYNNIDVEACTARDIPVGNTPGVLTGTTADCAFALLMAAARRIVEGADYVRAGKWKTWGPMLLMGSDVHGATLGIVGFGRIGQAVARRAQGFDMRVLYHDTYVAEADPAVGVTRVDLNTLLAESDFISLHVPLTEETYHLIGQEELRQCKPTAVLVNKHDLSPRFTARIETLADTQGVQVVGKLPFDPEVPRGPDRLAHPVDAAVMALRPGQPLTLGPAAVAIHDDRDVLGESLWVEPHHQIAMISSSLAAMIFRRAALVGNSI